MATVYRARQVLLDREVALKVMSPQLAQDPVYAQRFLQEARMLASLNHPNVVSVYDVGVTPEGLHYFSMQMLTGGDFADRLRDGISEQELVRVLVAVANALGFAHTRGYVHRDVAPGNIMFDEHDTPVLTDFGIARAVSATSRITQSGLSIGTSHYMSPEQARGIEVDHRSDIYSLGVLTYEALVGTPPFQGEDGFAVAFAHVHDPVPKLPEEAALWQPLIDRCMAKDPGWRFADCAEFVAGLRDCAPEEVAALGPQAGGPRNSGPGAAVGPVSSAPSPEPDLSPSSNAAAPALADAVEPPAARSPTSRMPLWIPLAAAGVLALSVVGGIAWWRAKPPAPKPIVVVPATATKPAPPTPVEIAPVGGSEASASMPSEDSTAPVFEIAPDPQASDALVVDPLASDQIVPDPNSPPVEPHTVIDPVATLIAMGRANIAANRLIPPPAPNNAVDRFMQALINEPNNAEAATGIAEVAQILLARADKADPQQNLKVWLELIAQAEALAKRHPAAANAAKLTGKRRQTEADRRVAAGRVALEAWDRAGADRAFAEALTIVPNFPSALDGQKQAAALGKVGYRFRDRVGEGTGPEMIVVAEGLALGRFEVTNGEFARFWAAAGAKQFAAGMPECRDREPFFGTSSAARTWRQSGASSVDNAPVTCLSYAMAEAYVGWLKRASGRNYRIPSAAELSAFSKPAGACGSNIRDAAYLATFKDSGGTSCDDRFSTTAPVGSFAAVSNLFDGDGNVREWTSDCDGNCKKRIAVGRSWHSKPEDKVKNGFPADDGFNTIGLRVARKLD